MGLFNKGNSEHALRQSSKIVVASGALGSGVSFISELLAFSLSKHGSVSVTELGFPHFYDSLGFEKNFLIRGYTDYFEKISLGERIDYKQSKSNSFEGINWICKTSAHNSSLSLAETFRAFYLPSEEFQIFDCSGLDADASLALLAEADYPICIIDPLPSMLMQSRSFLERLRIGLPECQLIVNKMNPGVHSSELNRFLGTKNYFSVASVSPEYIYRGEYNSASFCHISDIPKIMGKTQDMLSSLFL